MNEQEILELARKAIAEGESPDDVAAWIERSTGKSLEAMAKQHDAQMRLASGGGNAVGDFLHMAAEGATLGQADKFTMVPGPAGLPMPVATPGSKRGAQFQQRTDDLQALAPGASAAASLAGAVPGLHGVGRAGLAGLGPAVGAIRNLARNPLARQVVGDWLPKGGLGYLLLNKMFDGK